MSVVDCQFSNKCQLGKFKVNARIGAKNCVIMLVPNLLLRYFSTSRALASEKSLLATLRKKTGYTFVNCKKALELHNNNLLEAEKWLRDQAQAMGWSKASKLEGRQTAQGLVGVAVKDKNAVLVEINCETDFVAQNAEFQKLVAETAKSCMQYAQREVTSSGLITKICLSSEQLKNIPHKDGRTLADQLALMIGTVGENAALKRATCYKVQDGVRLSGYAHPSGKEMDNIQLGKFAGVVAYRNKGSNDPETTDKVGKEICQHVVGMNPQKVGNADDQPAGDKEDETCLIHQDYLLDESVTVKDVLEEHNLEILSFKRYECGENSKIRSDQPLEFVETCQ